MSMISGAWPGSVPRVAGYHTTARRPATCSVVKPTANGPRFAYGAGEGRAVVDVAARAFESECDELQPVATATTVVMSATTLRPERILRITAGFCQMAIGD